MAYLRPTSARISSSHADHKDRTPPSQEPGTDYGCGYGTNLAAPAAGQIVAVSNSTGGATGRYLTIDLDDGRRVRWLHLSTILVKVGARVSAGQIVARSGASAWGDEWGVGAHVHVSLFPRHSYGGFGPGSTLDFEKYIGTPASGGKPSPTTPSGEEEDEDMKVKFGHRKEGVDEWMIVHPQLKGGYIVTTSKARATAWSRLYKNGWARLATGRKGRYDFDVPRADYIEIQRAGAQAATSWRI